MKTKILVAALALLAGALSTRAQGTAFSYDGRLADDGSPANGFYELRFGLYDAALAGNPVAQRLNNAPVTVANGLFTVPLDFDSAPFSGVDRWLEIGVRTNGSASDFSTLAPRQPITPTLYALHARQAGSVNAANVTGTLADAQLPANVARLDAPTAFTGEVTFNNAAAFTSPAVFSAPVQMTNSDLIVVAPATSNNRDTKFTLAPWQDLEGGSSTMSCAASMATIYPT